MFFDLYSPSPLGTTLFMACFVAWAALEAAANLRLGRPGSISRDRWSRAAIMGGMVLALTLAVTATRAAAFNFAAGRAVSFYLGLALMAGGMGLRAWAIAQLGGYFVPEVAIQPGQRVYDQGLYRYLRHPSYAGTFVTILGYGLALSNWISLAIMLVIPGVAYGWRMRVEEAALTEAFGEEYRAYMRRTKRIIPFIL
ncbi:MAG: isoprenylcysteine carboxylmethyltransferase family protein [Anaerolineales bacterium]|nr:isoprenylcysteine carboxylmethyltransferase family protein [Anaerolineales bacterium]